MRVVLAIAVILACFASSANARECYACRPKKAIAGITLAADITNKLTAFPTCEQMEEDGASDKYKQKCSPSDKGCINIVDPKDETNRLRSCFPAGKDECQKSACYCTGELCNASSAVVASAVAMVTALLVLAAGH